MSGVPQRIGALKISIYAFRAGLGYSISVIVATVVTLAVMAVPTMLPDEGALGSFYAFIHDWPTALFIGLVFTSITALPGFLIAIWLAHNQRWSRWRQFAFAGVADAFFALILLQAYMGEMLLPNVLLPCFPGGFAGGAAYWHAAGRYLAARRSEAP